MTKYSLKNICLGIGIGLILASMANINVTPQRLTIDDIKREAEQYNLIVVDAKDMIKKQPEDANKQKDQQQAPSQPQASQEGQTVVVVIESGSTSESIAEKLLNSKLIENKQEFISRLRELNKESKVQIGSFKISKGASLDKIIETITASPK